MHGGMVTILAILVCKISFMADPGYKYELALVLNDTVTIPDLADLEQQVFKSFRQTTTSSTSLSSTPSTPSVTATPGRPHPTPGRTPRSKHKQTKDHFNYLLLDPILLDGINSAQSGKLLDSNLRAT